MTSAEQMKAMRQALIEAKQATFLMNKTLTVSYQITICFFIVTRLFVVKRLQCLGTINIVLIARHLSPDLEIWVLQEGYSESIQKCLLTVLHAQSTIWSARWMSPNL